jgi:hypothetical protein
VSESEEHQQAKPRGGKVYTKRSQGVWKLVEDEAANMAPGRRGPRQAKLKQIWRQEQMWRDKAIAGHHSRTKFRLGYPRRGCEFMFPKAWNVPP